MKELEFTPEEIVQSGLATKRKPYKGKNLRKAKKAEKTSAIAGDGEYSQPSYRLVLKEDSGLDIVFSETDLAYLELVDRFRNRLVTPIFDKLGKYVIGFGGRLMDTTSSQKERYKHAKYINSPESLIFSKKNTLFGTSHVLKYWSQLENKNNRREIILVEGYFDALALQNVGVQAVATMGTAISFEQLEIAAKCVLNGGKNE